jgi:hypothetical protein
MMDSLIAPEVRDWARAAIARIGAKVRRLPARRRRALLIHLDGVPRTLIEAAVATGRMPFLSRLVRSGTYRLDTAFWGSPASTPCFQAGLLYGLRHPDLPAYLWFDRKLGRRVQMNTPRDTAALEARLDRRVDQSLLAGDGTTYLSLFTAGASNQLAMSSLAQVRASAKAFVKTWGGLSDGARATALGELRHLVGGAFRTTREVSRWVRKLGDTRHEREYLINRGLLELGWDYARRRVVVDMVRGVPVIYLVFGTYDEVSHRRGPTSLEAERELWRVDSALEELFSVAQTVDAPYDVYFLTDHGHVGCTPFERRTGRSLEAHLGALDGGPGEALGEEVRRGLLDGRGSLKAQAHLDAPLVVDAGNFAHVYLDGGPRPLDARELLAKSPSLLARASRHPDVAITAVRRGEGAVALIGGGLYGPDQLHRAPLSNDFSRHATADLLRELPRMPNAGDLVLFGQTVEEGKTVAFAWEFGSHGGLTHVETQSMVCWPREGPVDLSGLTHSVQLHDRLMGAYRSD